MMFTLYKSQEPLKVANYGVSGANPSKMKMTPRCKKTTGSEREVKKKKKIRENLVLNRKPGIKLYSCSKDRGGV